MKYALNNVEMFVPVSNYIIIAILNSSFVFFADGQTMYDKHRTKRAHNNASLIPYYC